MRNSSGGKFQYKCHDDSNDQKKNDRSSDRISCFFWFLLDVYKRQTEAAPKYDEMIYYFLKAGYHVYMPEHMGHGQSYCLTADSSLVHIDTWKRYVRDFLKICHVIKKTYPELPLVLFAHSMGGAIGTIAAAWEPQLFQKIILNSPMLRPLTGNVPWPLVIAIAQTKRCV